MHDNWINAREVGSIQAALDALPAAVQGDRSRRLWNRLTEFRASAAKSETASPLVAHVSVLPRATIDFVRLLRQVDPKGSIQAHAGDGILRMRFSVEPDDALIGPKSRLRSAISAAGGSMGI